MDKKGITDIYRNVVSSIDYDDISYKEQEGDWLTAISVHFKSANRYVENFKSANPYSIIECWHNQVFDYLNSNKPLKIDIRGNIVTAVFQTPKKSDIDSIIYHAAYICSLMDLFNCALERKGIRNFDIGIGIVTNNSHLQEIKQAKQTIISEGIDLKSLLLAFEANENGFERIIIDDCAQFNISEMICYDDKKYSEVGSKRNSKFSSREVYGYNLNLADFADWIAEQKNDKKSGAEQQ